MVAKRLREGGVGVGEQSRVQWCVLELYNRVNTTVPLTLYALYLPHLVASCKAAANDPPRSTFPLVASCNAIPNEDGPIPNFGLLAAGGSSTLTSCISYARCEFPPQCPPLHPPINRPFSSESDG